MPLAANDPFQEKKKCCSPRLHQTACTTPLLCYRRHRRGRVHRPVRRSFSAAPQTLARTAVAACRSSSNSRRTQARIIVASSGRSSYAAPWSRRRRLSSWSAAAPTDASSRRSSFSAPRAHRRPLSLRRLLLCTPIAVIAERATDSLRWKIRGRLFSASNLAS